MTMSPGFWPAAQGPSHLAAVVIVFVPPGSALPSHRHRHRIGTVEVAGDDGMHRYGVNCPASLGLIRDHLASGVGRHGIARSSHLAAGAKQVSPWLHDQPHRAIGRSVDALLGRGGGAAGIPETR
jgi:hypothetical protein